MTLHECLARFRSPRKTGQQYLAHCPGPSHANGDRSPSLTIGEGRNGGTVLHCKAGCKTEDIVAAAGLTMADLMPPRSEISSPRQTPPMTKPQSPRATLASLSAAKGLPVEFLGSIGWEDQANGVLMTHRDEAGAVAPRSYLRKLIVASDDHSAIWTGERGRPTLAYGLDRLAAARADGKLVVCEGHTDTATCWFAKLPAIGIPGASTVGTTIKAEYFRDFRHVVLPRDNDPAGTKCVMATAKIAHAAGVAKITILQMPAGCKDVNDWFSRCADVETFRTEFRAAVNKTPDYDPAAVALVTESTNSGSVASPVAPVDASAIKPGLELTSLNDLLAEPDETVDWLVADRIPCGSLVLLAGKPKAGKSTLARDLALQVAKGGRWLGWNCSAGPVWYLAFEDKRSEVKKHFRAMGARSDDPVRFLFKQAGNELLADLHKMAEHERPALIIVDTLQRLIRAKDLNDYAEVTLKLTPLLTLSRDTGATLLLVHHAGKGDRAGIDSVLGSTALAGSVDNILLFGRSERYRVLSSQQRIGPDLPQTVVLFDESTGRVSSGQTREQTDIEQMKIEILAVLRDSQEPMTEAALGKEVEGRTTLKRAALRAMVGMEVERTRPGKKNAPYLYSCSVVPLYIREQENKKPEIAKQPDKHWSDSCSQKSTFFETGGRASEQETGPGNVLPELASVARERFNL